ncbi:aminotransferase class I/II-fold pyridoxal phosphate-dependent enzyme [bacterium]|nr:aminotransferase class I/II-fold pyridoxal phosphate-dependent enzyme [bacterium]
MTNYNKIETKLIHGGISGDKYTGSVNIPIYQTSTFMQDKVGIFKGYEYSRTGNPTRAALEALIAELENGTNGFAFASGMAAITAVFSILKTGDKVILSNNVYGGTYRVFDKVFRNFGINYSIEDTTNIETLKTKITPDVKAILIESPANPLLYITDINEVSKIAKQHNILTIVDNTFMTPYLQKPLDLGADIVIHSATKYLGGHSDLIAGLVVVNNTELAEKISFIQNATGGILQPFDSFLLIRGIKTLAVRMDRHVENAEIIVDFLSKHSAIKKVYYPGLIESQGYQINRKQAKNGGAMIAFELKNEYSPDKFFAKLKLITLAESLGGVESLICHPARMTHASIPENIRNQIGITDNLIRLSLGIENSYDILTDLEKALEESEK